jgi:hypothetical protein
MKIGVLQDILNADERRFIITNYQRPFASNVPPFLPFTSQRLLFHLIIPQKDGLLTPRLFFLSIYHIAKQEILTSTPSLFVANCSI